MLIIEIRDNSIKLIQAEAKMKTFLLKSTKVLTFEDGWKSFINKEENTVVIAELVKTLGKDNKALLCLNTASVLYRDMVVPKATPRYLTTLIRHELNHALNLSNEFLIDYTILGETVKNDKKMNKIMVTAVSASLLNEIIDFFDKAGIEIVKVDVALNSIRKYVEITKLAPKDKNILFADIGFPYIRQYLFEKGQYSVNRSTKISAMAETDAVNIDNTIETLEKMVQFALSQGQNSGIDQIVLFGSFKKIGHLKVAVQDKLGLDVSLLERPKILIANKKQPYDIDEAYALGALFSQRFKRKKDINLVTAYNSYFNRKSSSFNLDALFNSLAFGLGYLALFAVILNTVQTNSVNAQINRINAYLQRADVVETLAKIDSMKGNIAALSELTAELDSIQKVLDSIPRFNDIKITDFLSVKPSGIRLTSINFSENAILIAIRTNDPSLIHQYVLDLTGLDRFDEVTYTSYQYNSDEGNYSSEITLTLKGEGQ